jgi:ectoine hydroxylase-related dioxygenase (phytanoyl-CoA dioxygenase family)
MNGGILNTKPLSTDQIDQFNCAGFIIVRKMFNEEEMDLLLRTAKVDHNLLEHSFGVNDTAGRQSKLSLWNHPGDDIYGMIARCHRVVDAVEQLLGEEVYHYHSKMMLKEPKVGGAWEWHQDYGYWYQNGCLFPEMASCLIAVDRATKENGCIQMLEGSHKMGRIEHGRFGGQTGADPERVNAALQRMKLVHCEAEPGDAVLFHGNTLHCSAPNTSDKPRWSLICCYNTKHNDPYKDSGHPRYTPLTKVPDSAVREIGMRGSTVEASFYDRRQDKTVKLEQ